MPKLPPTATSDPTPMSQTAESVPAESDANLADKIELLVALGRALHAVGQPAHRLEELLLAAAKRLRVSLQVMALPTELILGWQQDGRPDTSLNRLPAGRINLARWSRLSAVADDVIQGRIEPAAARRRIAEIEATPDPWGKPAIVAAYVLSGGAFAVFFGGGVAELIAALGVGLAVGLVAAFMQSPRAARLFELVAAIAAGVVVGTIDFPLIGLDFAEWVPLAAGLIILLPGIMLVDAIEELAHGYLVAGGARLAGVGVVFLAMAFGMLLGLKITEPLPSAQFRVDPHSLSDWMAVPALAVVALGSLIRFRASLRDYGLILIGSVAALGAAWFGRWWLGPVIGEFFGAFVLGLVASACAYWTRCTRELLITPGICLLVPGSFGVRTMHALVDKNADAAVYTAFEMFLIGMALVAGLLFSDAVSISRDRKPA